MAVFLLECRKDEERHAYFCRKEASSPLLETMAVGKTRMGVGAGVGDQCVKPETGN